MTTIRLLIVSDTHDTAFPSLESVLPKHDDKKIDVLLHCGDLTMIGGLSNYRKAIGHLLAVPAELRLVIPGNHDVSLDPKWWAEDLIEDEDDPEEPEKALGMFTAAAPTSFAEGKQTSNRGGLLLLNEGVHKFTLSGGRSFSIYASPFTPEYGGYAFSYAPGEDRFNDDRSGRIPDSDMEVDIVMTHGPPAVPTKTAALPGESGGEGYKLDLGREGGHCGCGKLFRAVERARPLVHCFGHIHEGHGAQKIDWNSRELSDAAVVRGTSSHAGRGGEVPILKATARDRGVFTTFVNAAIMRHGEEEGNRPWIVELEV